MSLDTLIILNLIDIDKWFRLSIHNQTNMCAARVLSPHYMALFHVLTTGRLECVSLE